jgi:transposase-like protein
VKKAYRTIRNQGKASQQELAKFLSNNGQILLPMVNLVEQCRLACDDLIALAGRATLQAVLDLSAAEAAGGPPQQGKRRNSEVVFYGHQPGQVVLGDRQLEVNRPRLRTRGRQSREVEVPAYAALQNQSTMQQRMLELLMQGVSTRNYKSVIPQMAETAGVSRSTVSRKAALAAEAEVEKLLARRFEDLDLLVIYIDGVVFGDYTLIGVVGVDAGGNKHVLGLREGATENSTVVTALLEEIVARGVDPKRKRLFVIDGSKALRAAINAVFGADQPVQRCRAHKLRNVLDHLPKEDRAQAKAVLRAAWKLEPKEGIKRVKKLAAWLDERYPSAAASLLEGLEECFTINRLGLPPSLMRCLATTNIIESPHAGVRIRTRRVTHWQDGKMVLRWMASAFLQTEKHFRKVMGHRELWILKAVLRDDAQSATIQVAA